MLNLPIVSSSIPKERNNRSFWGPYGDFKVYEFLGECRHIIGEAKRVFPGSLRGKHEIALSLAFAVEHDLLIVVFNRVINVERSSRLDLPQISPIYSLTAFSLLSMKGGECGKRRLGGLRQSKRRFSRRPCRPRRRNKRARSRQFCTSAQWPARHSQQTRQWQQ
jgi:hypothetical protein